jgi:hypothetical protein
VSLQQTAPFIKPGKTLCLNNNNNNNNQNNLNTVPHSHQYPEISSERQEANKNHTSQEPEGKMGSKETAWTVYTEPG